MHNDEDDYDDVVVDNGDENNVNVGDTNSVC